MCSWRHTHDRVWNSVLKANGDLELKSHSKVELRNCFTTEKGEMPVGASHIAAGLACNEFRGRLVEKGQLRETLHGNIAHFRWDTPGCLEIWSDVSRGRGAARTTGSEKHLKRSNAGNCLGSAECAAKSRHSLCCCVSWRSS